MLLENQGSLLPLRGDWPDDALRVYLHGIAPETAARAGWTVVTDPKQADVAIMRLTAPFETLHPGYMFGAMQHEGSLAFRDGDPDYETFKRVSATVPTIVTVYLDRPAILTPLKRRRARGHRQLRRERCRAARRARPVARSRRESCRSSCRRRWTPSLAQRSDVAHDSARPLYPFGFGRRY